MPARVRVPELGAAEARGSPRASAAPEHDAALVHATCFMHRHCGDDRLCSGRGLCETPRVSVRSAFAAPLDVQLFAQACTTPPHGLSPFQGVEDFTTANGLCGAQHRFAYTKQVAFIECVPAPALPARRRSKRARSASLRWRASAQTRAPRSFCLVPARAACAPARAAPALH